MSNRRFLSPRSLTVALVAVVLLGLAIGVFIIRRGPALPGPGSETYEQTTSAFYHGLAALEVGLLDDARQQFAQATELVAEEPASWANLGVAQLRLGELEAAVAPVSRALMLAPDNGDMVLLAARMESARGNVDAAVTHLRRAVELDPRGLRARFALADEVERASAPRADEEAQMLLNELLALDPDNLAVLLENTRLAAKRGDVDRLKDSVARLERYSVSWPPIVVEQYRGLRTAVDAGSFPDAARATALLRNVLAPVPAFRESLARVRTPAELIAEPFERFLALTPAVATPSPPDPSVTFARESLAETGVTGATALVTFAVDGAISPVVFVADATRLRRVDRPGVSFPLPGSGSSTSLLALDWNHDFRTDIVVTGRGGLQLLIQGDDGAFVDATSRASASTPFLCDCVGAWAADIEMDGDLDVVIGVNNGATRVLRNNGDGTWRPLETFASVVGARAFGWADLDQDADPDAAFIDTAGALHVLFNRQAAQFVAAPAVGAPRALVGLAVADIDSDGVFDVLTLNEAGTLRRLSWRGETWETQDVGTWAGFAGGTAPGTYRLFPADLDNNGALDVVASGPPGSRAWLASATHRLEPLSASVDAEVYSVLDLNGDGRLDVAGLLAGQPIQLLGHGQANYHWKVIRSRAQKNAGDQRINSFGVGGDIEVRSGLLWQKQVLMGGVSHFGLGTRTSIDVARIVWPNGVPQAEFGIGVDDTVVAEQRLKGSCPWVFAYDGSGIQFVTDFLWRSPLGLRINAQDTAGVSQTEDWVRIRGDQLVPHDGSYDVRITAELWETHFFDHMSLMVVDHPETTDVFVDERFSAAKPPLLAVQAVGAQRPVKRAWDDTGRDVSALVERRDGRYVATFERGRYQGIAQEHFVEFELDEDLPVEGRLTLIAQGWVYPTDSSINMAIGQGRSVRPMGLSLEARDPDGRWTVIDADIGFPAGKNKTMLVDLAGIGSARRLRLRTNLEVYWDWLAVAGRVVSPTRETRLPLKHAELRYRGFSQTTSPRGEAPETPIYSRIANTAQRWRDLAGFYTRFGDVLELLGGVDDRYVIMNAGDELVMHFPEQAEPPAGWRRDFVLIGDGWEKDGDFNTGFSQTVLPLPSHDRPAYTEAVRDLEDDPVYQRYRNDWSQYHTRYVTPAEFVAGLRPH